MELLWFTFAVMCFLSNLNSSTYVATEEEKEKGKCPAVPEGIEHNCISIEARCCSTRDCDEQEGVKGMICCRRLCRFRCVKEYDPERVGNEPEINLTPEECRNLTGKN
ncbi:hypothetical protein TNCT_59321 [Trichonephila clavata]|uniref:WAP domain-containing protein n=1 Tax=Trichonephila clavata TaxID=2740835 RepID=A0A8X6FGW6_TRICU|nr:hypothetical protein TNCT_59321 [Trichonephila clavata]